MTNRRRHRGASVFDEGSFYGPGMTIGYMGRPSLSETTPPPPSLVPDYFSPNSRPVRPAENEQSVGLLQRLDQIVALVRDQAKETATIKQEIRSLKTEMEEQGRRTKF